MRMNFADFIAPMSADDFIDTYYGQRPLHIKAGGEAAARRLELLSWKRLNELLAILPHWTDTNIKLLMNSRPVMPDHYMDEVRTSGGTARRADPAKIHLFLAMGASLVADSIEDIAPEVRRAAWTLGDQFGGKAGANAYCSFKGIQAFASHCDLHEVFVVHLEGQKKWKIYEHRAEAPVETLAGDDAQALIDRSKGAVLMEIVMEPGDVLYIPRGYFHDAMASSDASLHLTFGVAPLNGRILFRMLEEMAVEDPDFRAYLPDGRSGGGENLGPHLKKLAAKLAAMLESPRFQSDLAARQLSLPGSNYILDLPDLPKLEFYGRTDRPAAVERRAEGALLVHGGDSTPLRFSAEAAEWALRQQAFSVQQLKARYPWLPGDELQNLIRLMESLGLISKFTPQL